MILRTYAYDTRSFIRLMPVATEMILRISPTINDSPTHTHTQIGIDRVMSL